MCAYVERKNGKKKKTDKFIRYYIIRKSILNILHERKDRVLFSLFLFSLGILSQLQQVIFFHIFV